MPQNSATNDPAAVYTQRVQAFDAAAREWERRCDTLSNLRMVAGLVVIGMLAAAWLRAADMIMPWLAAAAVGVAAFVVLIARNRAALEKRWRALAMAALNRQGLARLARAWEKLPRVEVPTDVTPSVAARDLDLFGSASLYRLCCQSATAGGRTMLARWFLSPAQPAEVVARQVACAELASQLDQRQELAWCGQLQSRGQAAPDTAAFLRWAEGPAWLTARPALFWFSRLSPVLMIVLVVGNVIGLVPAGGWQLLLLVNLAVSLLMARGVHSVFRQIDAGQQQLGRYADMLKLVEAWKVTAPLLVNLQARLAASGHRADEQLSRLGRLLTLADLRFSQLVYGLIQVFTLWDFHVLAALERWQRRCGPHVREWLDVLAEFEALSSLSTLAFDNPRWTWPKIDAAGPRVIAASDLAHPLLADGKGVGNDVQVGPEQTFLLVTGSNMSGKSTLLRAIGVNLVLAQAGAPVCARQLTMPRVLVETSMRIDDSLAAGVSLFLAELKRLRAIVDEARRCETPGELVLVFLLDEILHGTNSRDRQIAVRLVVQHLLDAGAIGAVSTHDLELAADGPLATSSRAVHFRESFSGEGGSRQMTFDYQLRHGIASSANALELLSLVGLADGVVVGDAVVVKGRAPGEPGG